MIPIAGPSPSHWKSDLLTMAIAPIRAPNHPQITAPSDAASSLSREFQTPLAHKANDSAPPKTYSAEIMSTKDDIRLDIAKPVIKINSKTPRSAFTAAMSFRKFKTGQGKRMPSHTGQHRWGRHSSFFFMATGYLKFLHLHIREPRQWDQVTGC